MPVRFQTMGPQDNQEDHDDDPRNDDDVNRRGAVVPPPPPPSSLVLKSPERNLRYSQRRQRRLAEEAKEEKKIKDESQKKGIFNRLSIRGITSLTKKQTPTTPVEVDPVVELLQARANQRVSFALTTKEPEKQQLPSTEDARKNNGALKTFIRGGIFGRTQNSQSNNEKSGELGERYEQLAQEEIDSARKQGGMPWEQQPHYSLKPEQATATMTSSLWKGNTSKPLSPSRSASFKEHADTTSQVTKLLNKARRSIERDYRYQYAVDTYLKALELLHSKKYPDDHTLVQSTLKELSQAHHQLNAYKNSANILKMGIRFEDNKRDLVKALKMYTIAYRIRRDSLGRNHPSLVWLLNMLGSLQIKRNDLHEAMDIFDLALEQQQSHGKSSAQYLQARSVTFRERGVIFEQWGDTRNALLMFHQSLECVAQAKGIRGTTTTEEPSVANGGSSPREQGAWHKRINAMHGDNECTELYLGKTSRKKNQGFSEYDVFFPSKPASSKASNSKKSSDGPSHRDGSDTDVALTLHHIAGLYKSQGKLELALSTYGVALRGMKQALGKSNPSVAAVLGNIGNLQKHMGEFDAAFETYQQVLSIESSRLGISHPQSIVTLHNIATIDAARGNNEQAILLYRQVINLQRQKLGSEDPAIAVTSACMGDIEEKLGNIDGATECYEEAVRIKTTAMGRHSLDVARLLHKLGKLAMTKGELHLASSYVSRAMLVYRLNKLLDEDDWMVDALRDSADIDAAIVMSEKPESTGDGDTSTLSSFQVVPEDDRKGEC